MPRLQTPWILVPLAAGALALALSACGSSTPTVAGGTSTTLNVAAASGNSTTTTIAAGATTTTAAGPAASSSIAPIPAADLSPTGRAGVAPTVVVPKDTPPTQLESANLLTGTGAAAKAGDNVTVEYVLATYSSGGVVQSSWTSQPFQFTLGAGQVIPGWDQGVVGMQVGGRRELIIPPALGYGANSPGAGIAANDTLVFVIDLQKIG